MNLKNSFFRLGTVTALGLLVCACGGGKDGDGGPGPICEAIGGGGSKVTTTADAGSSFLNAPAAFDGDLASYATLTVPTGIIRGTAQPGVIVAGGRDAGIALSNLIDTFLNNGVGPFSININTYKGGVLQESQPAELGVAGLQGFGQGEPGFGTAGFYFGSGEYRDVVFFFIHTTADFDAIEAVITAFQSNPNNPTEGKLLQIHELCVR